MYEKEQRAKDEKFGAEMLDGNEEELEDGYSMKTLSDDKIYTESLIS